MVLLKSYLPVQYFLMYVLLKRATKQNNIITNSRDKIVVRYIKIIKTDVFEKICSVCIKGHKFSDDEKSLTEIEKVKSTLIISHIKNQRQFEIDKKFGRTQHYLSLRLLRNEVNTIYFTHQELVLF